MAATWHAWDATLDPVALDAPRPNAWTIREIADHVAGITWYAEQIGHILSPA